MNPLRLVVYPSELLEDKDFSRWLSHHSLTAVSVNDVDGVIPGIQDIAIIRWSKNCPAGPIADFSRQTVMTPLPLVGWHDGEWPPVWIADSQYFGLQGCFHPGSDPAPLQDVMESYQAARRQFSHWDRSIIQMFLDHLTRMTGETAECLDFIRWPGFHPCGDLTSICHLYGAVDCTLSLHILQRHARALTSIMLGIPLDRVSCEMNSDTCREILNVITGWIKAELTEQNLAVEFNHPLSAPGALRLDLGCGRNHATARFRAGDIILCLGWNLCGEQLPV